MPLGESDRDATRLAPSERSRCHLVRVIAMPLERAIAMPLEWLRARSFSQGGQHRVFSEACHGKLVHSSFMFLFLAAWVASVQWFDKKSGAYHTSFNHQRLTKRPKSNAKMYVNQRREDWREKQSTHYVTIISVRNTGTSTIFRAPFSTTFRCRIFLQTTGIGASKAHFREKLKIDKLPELLL